MRVVKRNGSSEEVSFDKILNRVKNRAIGLEVEPVLIAQKVVAGLYDQVTTRETDRLLIETAASLAPEHPDYDKLASTIAASALHKETPDDFIEAWKELHTVGVISDRFIKDAQQIEAELREVIDYSRDFTFSYFGFKTLESRYLLGSSISLRKRNWRTAPGRQKERFWKDHKLFFLELLLVSAAQTSLKLRNSMTTCLLATTHMQRQRFLTLERPDLKCLRASLSR